MKDDLTMAIMFRVRGLGYSVQLSSNFDTAVLSKNSGLPMWTCAIRSRHGRRSPSLKPGIRIRCIMVQADDAVFYAWRELINRGGETMTIEESERWLVRQATPPDRPGKRGVT